MASDPPVAVGAEEFRSWRSVRAQFSLSHDWVHLGGFLLASHPPPVRRAIEAHRRRLDLNPVHYLHEHQIPLELAVLRQAARYLGARPQDIALTDSTTMGLGLLYNGIKVRSDQEMLTTEHDFFATHTALRLKASRTGAGLRVIRLYRSLETVSAAEIVDTLVRAVRPRTRVVAITWVHSSTGLRLPIAAIAAALGEVNRNRGPADRALLCVDGVHGFGVENTTMPGLGCHFFVSGCHKWLFGPRGTGFVWGRPQAWDAVGPTIPSFTDDGSAGSEMTPGGFHSFEHRWALAEAFRFHLGLGKARIAKRTHALNRQLRGGLAAISRVRLVTPRPDSLSAGIVCFEVAGLSPPEVVGRLRARGIVATVTPYSPSYVRLAAAIFNSPVEVDAALRAVRAIAR